MHLRREHNENKIHISHLHRYISAYVTSPETVHDLVSDITFALNAAKNSGEVQIVDQDGECCFHVSPFGYITLMLPWKQYVVYDNDMGEDFTVKQFASLDDKKRHDCAWEEKAPKQSIKCSTCKSFHSRKEVVSKANSTKIVERDFMCLLGEFPTRKGAWCPRHEPRPDNI